MHKLYFALLLATSFCFSQTLSIESGSFISINPNTSITVDGLELSPSVVYTLAGPNSITRSSIPIEVGNNSSIERVYELTAELPNYSGILSFSYLDAELNGIDKNNLVLEVLDANGVWTNVTPSHDLDNNILSYDFTQPVGFKKVTASDISAPLTIKSETLNDLVRVYPNPTMDKLFIVSNSLQRSTLFNSAGQKILESTASELDVMNLPSGIYLLNLQNTQNQISTFKIIKK